MKHGGELGKFKVFERRQAGISGPRLAGSIKGAYFLANIAPVNAIADGFAEFFWYRGLRFNGEVGNTSSCDEHMRLHKGLGGAFVQAGCALAAFTFCGFCGWKLEVHQ